MFPEHGNTLLISGHRIQSIFSTSIDTNRSQPRITTVIKQRVRYAIHKGWLDSRNSPGIAIDLAFCFIKSLWPGNEHRQCENVSRAGGLESPVTRFVVQKRISARHRPGNTSSTHRRSIRCLAESAQNIDQSFSPFSGSQNREKFLNKYNRNGVFTAKDLKPLALTQTPRSNLHFSQHALQKITNQYRFKYTIAHVLTFSRHSREPRERVAPDAPCLRSAAGRPGSRSSRDRYSTGDHPWQRTRP